MPVEDIFFTAVAPASVGYDARNEHYASERDYVFAIADALREEYLEIHKAGVVLQVDDAVLANMYDHSSSRARTNTANGRSCASRRSTTRSTAFRRIASAITSASAAGTCRTSRTRRWRTSST